MGAKADGRPWRALAGFLLWCGLVASAWSLGAAAQDAGTPVDVPEQVRIRDVAPEPVDADTRAILSRFGQFERNETYGEVWRPTVTPPGWHPYPPCHWVKARHLGFYYDDPSEWGRVVHHYGRWSHDVREGWLWIPGRDFSPGWVVWRSSPAWTGWAPLPPLPVGDVATADTMAGTDSWLFQETPRLLAGCDAGLVAPAAQDAALIADVPYVRSFGIGGGIAVFGVPRWVGGPFVAVDAVFRPWPNGVIASIVSEWNWIWHHTTQTEVRTVCIRSAGGL